MPSLEPDDKEVTAENFTNFERIAYTVSQLSQSYGHSFKNLDSYTKDVSKNQMNLNLKINLVEEIAKRYHDT